MDVVASGAEQDLLWPVGEDNAVGEVRGVDDFGPAEAAIDDRVVGEILLEGFPESDGRGADEENSALAWRVDPIGRLEGADLFLPAAKVMRGRRQDCRLRRDLLRGHRLSKPVAGSEDGAESQTRNPATDGKLECLTAMGRVRELVTDRELVTQNSRQG